MPCWKLARRSLVCAADRGSAAAAAAPTAPGTRFAFGTRLGRPACVVPEDTGACATSGRPPPFARGGGPAGRSWRLAGHRSRPVGAEPAAPEPVGFDGLENWQPVLLAGARRGRHDHARRAAIAGRRPITGRPVAVPHAAAGQRPATTLPPLALPR